MSTNVILSIISIGLIIVCVFFIIGIIAWLAKTLD